MMEIREFATEYIKEAGVGSKAMSIGSKLTNYISKATSAARKGKVAKGYKTLASKINTTTPYGV